MVLRSFFSYLSGLWRLLRFVTGDDAYDRYLQSWHVTKVCPHMHLHDDHPLPMARREFVRRRMHERWQGIRRCC